VVVTKVYDKLVQYTCYHHVFLCFNLFFVYTAVSIYVYFVCNNTVLVYLYLFIKLCRYLMMKWAEYLRVEILRVR
jgi:hypothetical protein